MKKSIVLLLVMMALCAMTVTSFAQTYTVAMNTENAPWEFYENGELKGFEVDILNEWAKRAGVTLDFKSTPFATVLTGVQAGQFDIGASSIWVKPERAEAMDLSNSFYDAVYGMIVREDEVFTIDEMAGKDFGADTGGSNHDWLKNNVDKYGPYEIHGYDNQIDPILDVQAGRIDGALVDAPNGLWFIMQNPDSGVAEAFEIADVVYGQSFAFTKGSGLRDQFNAVLTEMKADGAIAEIYEKWFGQAPAEDSSAVVDYPLFMPGERPDVK